MITGTRQLFAVLATWIAVCGAHGGHDPALSDRPATRSVILKYRLTNAEPGSACSALSEEAVEVVRDTFDLQLEAGDDGRYFRPVHPAVVDRMDLQGLRESDVIAASLAKARGQRGQAVRVPDIDYGLSRLVVIELSDDDPEIGAVIARLRDRRLLEGSGLSIEGAWPNALFMTTDNNQDHDAERPTMAEPFDPLLDHQWALHNIGQTGGSVDADIDALAAWALVPRAQDAVIAIIDTGVDANHEDLAAAMWRNPAETHGVPGQDDDGNGYIDDLSGWDFVHDGGAWCALGEDCTGRDNDPADVHGHGTHCAGIAGAMRHNSRGIAGVAPGCRIMRLRAGFASATGQGLLYDADIHPAILYAIENGADVISMSFGGSSTGSYQDLLELAEAAGVIVVASAGNEASAAPTFPAAHDTVIAVAATDHEDAHAAFSNHGPWIDVAAPGVDILSTIPGGGYASLSGTSMAAPHVAGVAALVRALNPGLSSADVRGVLLWSADDRDVPGFDPLYGFGRLDAHAAVSMAPIGPDCNGNGVHDLEDVFETASDCNGNNVPDGCEVAVGTAFDCNDNGIPDACDMDDGASDDADGNNWPDECQQNHHVPAQYPSIQAAISAAADWDTVVVGAGHYLETISFEGKSIIVRSAHGPGRTIIDAGGAGSTVTFDHGEGPLSVLDGFTITGGIAPVGGGIKCVGSSPTVRHCRIVGNKATAPGFGGGVYNSIGRPTITHCRISGNGAAGGAGVFTGGVDPNGTISHLTVENCMIDANEATGSGGGIRLRLGHLTVRNSAIIRNTALGTLGGGALFSSLPSEAMVLNSTIVANTAVAAGGAIAFGVGDLALSSTILWNNSASQGDCVHLRTPLTTVGLGYCIVQGGVTNMSGSGTIQYDATNLDVDPHLQPDDVHIADTSPCIDGGDPQYVPLVGETDIGNLPRVVNQRIDIGADEHSDPLRNRLRFLPDALGEPRP